MKNNLQEMKDSGAARQHQKLMIEKELSKLIDRQFRYTGQKRIKIELIKSELHCISRDPYTLTKAIT